MQGHTHAADKSITCLLFEPYVQTLAGLYLPAKCARTGLASAESAVWSDVCIHAFNP